MYVPSNIYAPGGTRGYIKNCSTLASKSHQYLLEQYVNVLTNWTT